MGIGVDAPIFSAGELESSVALANALASGTLGEETAQALALLDVSMTVAGESDDNLEAVLGAYRQATNQHTKAKLLWLVAELIHRRGDKLAKTLQYLRRHFVKQSLFENRDVAMARVIEKLKPSGSFAYTGVSSFGSANGARKKESKKAIDLLVKSSDISGVDAQEIKIFKTTKELEKAIDVHRTVAIYFYTSDWVRLNMTLTERLGRPVDVCKAHAACASSHSHITFYEADIAKLQEDAPESFRVFCERYGIPQDEATIVVFSQGKVVRIIRGDDLAHPHDFLP